MFHTFVPLTNKQYPTYKQKNFVNDMQLLLNEYFIVCVEHEIFIFIQCSNDFSEKCIPFKYECMTVYD